ncbi:MAG: hypothetical protein ACI9FB_000749 [Candidatus Azotimanducaceae bacterium]|jgi:hypothetical protein
MKKDILLALGIALLIWTESALAYIDPGSGSAIMSAIVGFFLAISIAIKTYWYKLKSLLGLGKSDSKTDSEEESEKEK